MEEFELSEVTEHEQELEPAELEPATASTICWYCWKRGVNIGKLICPCKCTDDARFIHIECLEIYVNTRNVLRCQYCHVPYPLELKRKSLLEFCRNRNTLLWLLRKVFILLFYIFVGIIATVFGFYFGTSDRIWYFKTILITFFCFFILYSIYKTVSMIIAWSRSIYKYYHEWYESTQELKAIQQNLIQETEL